MIILSIIFMLFAYLGFYSAGVAHGKRDARLRSGCPKYDKKVLEFQGAKISCLIGAGLLAGSSLSLIIIEIIRVNA